MDTLCSFPWDNFWVTISFSVCQRRHSKNLFRAKMNADIALLAAVRNEINLASRKCGLFEVYGPAPINFHGVLPFSEKGSTK
jgi:hypothetical protein